MPSQFESLIREFGNIAGLESLSPNEHGECVFGIDDFVVTLAHRADCILFYAPVGKMVAENREALQARLLAGNYFFAETRGATLGVSPFTDEIQLIYELPLTGVDVSVLIHVLEDFLDRLEFWADICRQGSAVAKKAVHIPLSKMSFFDGIRG